MYPSENSAIMRIKQFFDEKDKKTHIYKNQKNKKIACILRKDGIEVDYRSDSELKDFFPWGVFWHAVHIMLINGGKARRGDAHSGHRLGSNKLPFNSIEGHIAHVIYGQQSDESVYSRISPIAYILIDSGVCVSRKGDMQLQDIA